jgi:hypothetical protein
MGTRLLALAAALLCSGLAVFAQDAASLAQRAQQAYNEKRFAESARLFAEAVEKGATHPNVAYNAACSFALAGDADRAFQFLDRAIAAGYRDSAHLQADADLGSLHGDARWKQVVARAEAAEKAYLDSINAEAYHLYQQDQADRSGNLEKADWEAISKRDLARRQRVREMLAAGSLKVADDFFHAAMVLQHGDKPEDYQLAHELASKAADMDPKQRVARWLAAAAKDRYLWSVGKPQIYGTQFKRSSADGPWTIDPIDEKALTDEERVKAGVPTLADTRRRLEQMNAELKKTP